VAQLLIDQGRHNVHYLQGGFDAWRRAGYPLVPK
jgi:rhodanese-related sulfurtransferase